MQARMITVVNVALKTSHGPIPPNAKAMLSTGRLVTSSSRTNSSEETNLPHQICQEVSNEVSKPERVRCSFSRVMEPALKMGTSSSNSASCEYASVRNRTTPTVDP